MADPVIQTGTDPSGADALYGLVRIGRSVIALDIGCIREVVPHPGTLLPFPATAAGAVGAIELRGTLIPVFDLAALLRAGDPGVDAAIIMVLRDKGHVFGVVIHEVCAVRTMRNAAIARIAVAGEDAMPNLAGLGFVMADFSGVIVDAGAIAALPGLPKVEETALTRARPQQSELPVLSFSIGQLRFGLPATAVDASIPTARLEPSPVSDPLWIASVEHGGRRIPVIDTLAVLGLGRSNRKAESAGVVIRMPEDRLIALAIDTVDDMHRIRESDIQPFAQFPIGAAGLFLGLLDKCGLSLLIDADALSSEPALIAISSTCETVETGEHVQSIADFAPYLLAEIGNTRFAVPLSQIEEIERTGKEIIPLAVGGHHLRGLLTYRGCAVPLCDTAARLGMPARDTADGFIVIVKHRGRRMGFLCHALHGVERLRLQVLAGSGSSQSAGLIEQTVLAADGINCPVLDLAAFIGETTLSCASAG